jgi:ABC-type nitrate/sulfonate/bicarbonate transport system substrate-binding protein
MKTFVWYIIIAVVIVVGSLFLYKEFGQKQQPSKLSSVIVALDWTPNTNHTGIFIAKAKDIYKDEGLDVKILPYTSNASPDILVTNGKADIGIGSAESVLADFATGNPVVSIAAIVQHNTSGFISLADNGINSPKDFDNKIYGGGGSLSESAVVSAIIKKDGGKGEFKNVSLDVEAMQALESKKVDFVWVFEGWEVTAAKLQGLKVKYFPSLAFGIPDYYTPVIITSPKEIKEKAQILKKFMAATAKGYEYARVHPKEAANILISANPKGTFSDPNFILESQKFLSKAYADPSRKWGWQDKENWHNYPQFLIDSKAVLDSSGKPVAKMDFDKLYTNEFLQ